MEQSPATGEEEKFMRLAIAAARRGLGLTHPNPAVGAVIVKNRRVIATGWHRTAGGPHAEIDAIQKLSAAARHGATIFVTLEPCSTHGRTPPCTDALIRSGIVRVIYGTRDPNPKHGGRADRLLGDAGIIVRSGVLADECAAINSAWNKWILTGLPLVIAKTGMSLDGHITSPPGRRWITSNAARADAMRLRADCDAIIVGGETVRTDNPRLTIRGLKSARPQPLRVVWTRSSPIPPDCHLLNDSHRERTIVYRNAPLRSVLRDLGKKGVQQVLIEGGGRVLGEAFHRRLVDKIVFYIAPKLIGGPVPAVAGRGAASNGDAIRLENASYKLIGGDIRIMADVRPASSSDS
jgi:diaminohydroxyphosphoribosylaminopyrimidine deaminase/5-amino-6-(5-phosphoribosylamino)uracil reductase